MQIGHCEEEMIHKIWFINIHRPDSAVDLSILK